MLSYDMACDQLHPLILLTRMDVVQARVRKFSFLNSLQLLLNDQETRRLSLSYTEFLWTSNCKVHMAMSSLNDLRSRYLSVSS